MNSSTGAMCATNTILIVWMSDIVQCIHTPSAREASASFYGLEIAQLRLRFGSTLISHHPQKAVLQPFITKFTETLVR